MDPLIVHALAKVSAKPEAAGKDVQAALESLRAAGPQSDEESRAVAFMMSMAPESKSQLFQDLWALWASGLKSGGYFVEFGAASGVEISNTWLLEKKLGWTGLLAEPNPVFFDSLTANRSCAVSNKCVYTRTGDRMEFLASKVPEFSGLASVVAGDNHEEKRRRKAHTIEVETISLEDLLVEHGAPRTIDFLSVDTEGSEFDILAGFDFGRWDIRAIAVEHNYTPARQRLYDLLTSRGFRRQLANVSRHDDWYVKDA